MDTNFIIKNILLKMPDIMKTWTSIKNVTNCAEKILH